MKPYIVCLINQRVRTYLFFIQNLKKKTCLKIAFDFVVVVFTTWVMGGGNIKKNQRLRFQYSNASNVTTMYGVCNSCVQ